MSEMTQSEKWISQAHVLIDTAYDALYREMTFVLGSQYSRNRLEGFVEYLEPNAQSYDQLQGLAGYLTGESTDVSRLKEAVVELAEETNAGYGRCGSQKSLMTLARKADTLRYFTEMWLLYREAWERWQSPPEGDTKIPSGELGLLLGWPEGDEETKPPDKLRAVQAANEVVRALYSVVEGARDNGILKLVRDPSVPTVVPFISRLYITGLDSPMPVIAAPYWGYEQVWTWLGYAHEVGHHVYRNVRGLRDELMTKVMMELWFAHQEDIMQCIWFNWAEEVFADIYGFLQIGAAFARSQQRMLLHLPLEILREIEADDRSGKPRDLREALLVATEGTRPMPYIRARIAWKALDMLGWKSEAEELEKQWNEFFGGPDAVNTSEVVVTFQRPGKHGMREEYITVAEMDEATDTVLEVMLEEDLYALGGRKVRDVFVHPEVSVGTGGIVSTAIYGHEVAGDLRHLLAAALGELEKMLEENEDISQDIQMLSDQVISAIERRPTDAAPT